MNNWFTDLYNYIYKYIYIIVRAHINYQKYEICHLGICNFSYDLLCYKFLISLRIPFDNCTLFTDIGNLLLIIKETNWLMVEFQNQ